MLCVGVRAADEPWKRSNAYVMSFSGDWKDLSAKFVLQVWRDYCFTRSRPFLTDLYSLCKVCTVSCALFTVHCSLFTDTLSALLPLAPGRATQTQDLHARKQDSNS